MAESKKKYRMKDGIIQRGKDCWAFVVRVPDPTRFGRTKQHWISGFDSRQSAKIARDRHRVSIAHGDFVAPDKVTVGDFLIKWLELHRPAIKPTTAEGYAGSIRLYLVPELGHVPLQKLRPSHIQEFYNKLLTTPGCKGKALSKRTVEQAGAILRIALKYAVDVEGLLSSNVALKVKLPRATSPKVDPWSLQELKTFFDMARSHRLFFFWWLGAFTGGRRGELLALRWSDFNDTSVNISKSRTTAGREIVELSTTKGGHNGRREVELDPETLDEFRAHRRRMIAERLALGIPWDESGYVFTQENGDPLGITTPSDVFRKVSKRAGLRLIRLHDLRHLHATELLELGTDLATVAQRLGHRDAMVTATVYAHVTKRQAQNASTRFADAFTQA